MPLKNPLRSADFSFGENDYSQIDTKVKQMCAMLSNFNQIDKVKLSPRF